MTHYFGIHDPGRAGGSWLIQCCNRHPVPGGITVLGEAHLPTQFNFEWPVPGGNDAYDRRIIDFLQSQADQGKAATGIVKCFHSVAIKWMRDRGGRFYTQIRNPLELVAAWKNRRGWGQTENRKQLARRAIGHFPPQSEKERWACLLYEIRKKYKSILARVEANERIVRIEDLNRSMARDGMFFKTVCEWITQVPFPDYYVNFIRKYYLPGYRYPVMTILDDDGVVRGVRSIIPPKPDRTRMNWYDDRNPTTRCAAWTDSERAMCVDYLGQTCAGLGYNCSTNFGGTDVEWPGKGRWWGDADEGLEPVPWP